MKLSIFVAALSFFPLSLFAHGENTPGPHGGHIQMPGAFHTELLVNKDQSVQIYLLDVGFKNPVTKDSEVTLLFKDKNGTLDFKCSAKADYFLCLPQKAYGAKGELVVKAVRQKAVGAEAVYKLPLSKH